MPRKASSYKNDDGAATGAPREEPLQAVLLADDVFDMDPTATDITGWRPLLGRPKVLCPLNNVTLLDYTVDYLARQNIDQLFVVCVHNVVEEYVHQRYGSGGSSTTPTTKTAQYIHMEIVVIKDHSLMNAGDALRELDRRDVIQDVFVLCHGAVISNVTLAPILQQQRDRYQKDRSAIMTILLQAVGESRSSTYGGSYYQHAALRSAATDDLVVGVDPTQQQRIVLYHNMPARSHVTIPCALFVTTHPRVELHRDLHDCGLDVCMPEVLARFTDEFDYGQVRRHFVSNSVAEEEEGLQNKMHAHVLSKHEYVGRIMDVATYHAVAQDVLRRWGHPGVVPDHHDRVVVNRRDNDDQKMVASSTGSNGHPYCSHYALQPRQYCWYQEQSRPSHVGRTSKVRGPGMLGSGGRVGQDCVITGSVIGHDAVIGDGARLENCHVWNHVRVHQGATVQHAILADHVVIGAGAVVPRGCVLGPGCIVGENVHLPEFTRLTLEQQSNDDDDAFSDDWEGENDDDSVPDVSDAKSFTDPDQSTTNHNTSTDNALVGPDGQGFAWQPPPMDDNVEDEEDLYGMPAADRIKAQSMGFDVGALLTERQRAHQECDDDGLSQVGNHVVDMLDAYSDDDAVMFDGGGADGLAPSSGTTAAVIGRQKGVDVVKELKTICLEYEESSPIENLAIELNSFKFSQNASYADCTRAAMLAILDRLPVTANMKDSKLVADFKTSIAHWSPLLQKMSIGLDEERAMVEALEQAATATATTTTTTTVPAPTSSNAPVPDDDALRQVLSTGMSFRFLLQTLHDEEIVSEEAILSWAATRRHELSAKDDTTPRARLFWLPAVQDFLTWLAEAGSSGSGSGSDSSSEDESDG